MELIDAKFRDLQALINSNHEIMIREQRKVGGRRATEAFSSRENIETKNSFGKVRETLSKAKILGRK